MWAMEASISVQETTSACQYELGDMRGVKMNSRCFLIEMLVFLHASCCGAYADPVQEEGHRFSATPKAGWQSRLAQVLDNKEGYRPFAINSFAMPDGVKHEFERLDKTRPIESLFFDFVESVCPPDDRMPEANNEIAPWSGICQLIIDIGSGERALGSGFLVSERCVVTAGHCVHRGEGGGYFSQVEVIPGCRGNYRPFGSQMSSVMKAADGWTINGRLADDYGVIILPQPFVASSNGQSPAMGVMAVLDDAALLGTEVYICGYPADKPFGTLFSDSDPIRSVAAQRLFYDADTYGGNSGCPVIFGGPGGPIVGIHNYGGCNNKSTRLNDSVVSQIRAWIDEIAAGEVNEPVSRPD